MFARVGGFNSLYTCMYTVHALYTSARTLYIKSDRLNVRSLLAKVLYTSAGKLYIKNDRLNVRSLLAPSYITEDKSID